MIKLLSLQANNFKQLQDVNIRFPSCGSILIEGRNEAGKSTLFEAVFFALFGKPLLQGTTVEDLIGYQSTDGIVLLEIGAASGRFLIQRKIRRAKTRATAEARLRVYGIDGTEGEEIRGASAVNERLQQELKLDSDAFLNSCFVEQKKLEKLEGMTASDREKSLMRLLNMDRMLDDERNLRITIEDTRRLQRLEQRVRLAEVMAEIPGVLKKGRECKLALDIVAMKELLSTIDARRSTIAVAEARLAALEQPVRDLEDRIRRIEAIRAAGAGAEIIAVRLDAVERQARDIARLRDQLSELSRVETEEIPALAERLGQIRRLRGRWTRLIALDSEASRAESEAEDLKRRLADAGAAQQAVSGLEARVAAETEQALALEAEERELAVAERVSVVRQALEDWQAAVAARDGVETITVQASEAESKALATEERLGRARAETSERLREAKANTVLAALCCLALAVTVAFAVRKPAVGILAVLLAATLAILLVRRGRSSGAAKKSAAEEARLSDALREAQNAFVRLEGQMENARATSGAAAGRLEQAVIRLEAAGEPVPSSAQDAADRLSDLPPAVDAVDAARLANVRRELAQVQGAIEEQRRAISARQAEIAAVNVPVLQASAQRMDAWTARVRETVLSHWAGIARDRAAALGIETADNMPANREATSAAESALAEQIRQMQARLGERAAIERRVEDLSAAGDREREEMRAAWPPIAFVRPDAALPETVDAAESLRGDLGAELSLLDENGARAELRKRRDEANAAENDRTVARREAGAAEAGRPAAPHGCVAIPAGRPAHAGRSRGCVP